MEPEATVHGALMFVLHISRCMGCAPVRLLRARNGYRVTVSHPIVYFGYACFMLFCTLLVSGFTIDLYHYIRRNIQMEFPILKIVDMLTCVILNTFVYLNSTNRIKHMIEHLNIINEIRFKISNDFYKWKPVEWKRIIIISSLILEYILTNLMAILQIYITNSNKGFTVMFYVSIEYTYLMLFLIGVQIILMIYEVHDVFKTAKVKLVEILNQTNDINLSSDTSLDLTRKSVRDLMNTYISAYNLIDQMIQRDGYILFFIIASFVRFFILDLWTIFDQLGTKNETRHTNIYYLFSWFFINVVRIFYTIEPFHLIIKESTEIQILFTNIMANLTPAGKPRTWEWNIIYEQLCLLDSTFQPLGIFSLQRSIIIKIISFVTTYLVIFIENAKTQLHK